MVDVRLPSVGIGDIVTICTDTVSPARWQVWDGVAPPDATLPFVSIFELPAARLAVGLAAECWGTLDAGYQVSCFGASVAQARWLADKIIGQAWPDTWTLGDTFGPLADTTPAPAWVLYPLTFVHHG